MAITELAVKSGLTNRLPPGTPRPSLHHTLEIARALAAVPMPPEAARLTEPADEEIRLRAYFISERRRRFALPGDADSDWHEAKQQFLSELSGRSTITTEEPSEIPARTEEIALPAVATSAETEVRSMQRSVQLTFSFEVAAMQLTPTFKMGVLQVRPISNIVTMHLARSQRGQLEVTFEIAKIQPMGKTLGTVRVTPSEQERPIKGLRSIAGLQLVPNGAG